MMHETFRFFQIDTVQNLHIAERPQGTDAQRLSLSAGKQAGTMGTRQQPTSHSMRPDLIEPRPSGRIFSIGDESPHFFFDDVLQHFLDVSQRFRRLPHTFR